MSDLKYRLRYADQDLDHGEIAKVKLACWEALERIEALEAGLKPFVNEAKWWPRRWNDDCTVHVKAPDDLPTEYHVASFNLADLRHAASLLEKKT